MTEEQESRDRNLDLIAQLLGRPVTPRQVIPKKPEPKIATLDDVIRTMTDGLNEASDWLRRFRLGEDAPRIYRLRTRR